jgi:hypothetical protein
MLPISIQREIDDLVLRFNAANPTNTIPTEAALAVVDVESNGKPYSVVGGVKRPTILFEPHLLYRRLSGAARDEAVAARLAAQKRDKKLYGKTQADRWAQIAAAQELLRRHKLDPGIAIECTSFGVGQVLGQNWKALGFGSVNEFFDLVNRDIAGQVEVMLRYIVVNDLDDELREGRWAAFARGYNGPAYAQNHYDTRMAAAARQYGGDVGVADGMLRMGSKGARVREMQALLVRAGYQVKVDGDFGPSTKAALKQFQKAHGLSVDGVYGPQTESALGQFRQGAADKPGSQKPIEIDGVAQGGGGIAGGIAVETLQNKVDEATATLQQVNGFEPWIGYGLAALSLIAVGLAVWGTWRLVSGWLASTRTVEA